MYFAAVARTPVLLPLLCGLLASGPVSAQSTDTTGGRLVGRVLDDETGKPIAGVSLDLDPGPVRQISDPAGAFLFPAVRQGIHDLTIEHLAYGRITRPVNVPPGASVQLDIRLVPRAVALDSMVVQVTLRDPVMERGGYYDRKRAGWGFFLEGRDLERPVVSDILQNVPRLEVLTGRSRLEQ